MIQSRVLLSQHAAAVCATPTPSQKNLISKSILDLFFRNQNRLIDLMIHKTSQAMQTLKLLGRAVDLLMAEIPKAAHRCLPDNPQALRLTD